MFATPLLGRLESARAGVRWSRNAVTMCNELRLGFLWHGRAAHGPRGRTRGDVERGRNRVSSAFFIFELKNAKCVLLGVSRRTTLMFRYFTRY